jgi:hypothetical protein
MSKMRGYYYMIDMYHNPDIYEAKGDEEFMEYFIENIDEFRELFSQMDIINSDIKNRLDEVYDTKKYDLDDDKDWKKMRVRIQKIIRGMTYEEFVREMDGKCTDGGGTPFVSIMKVDKQSIKKI